MSGARSRSPLNKTTALIAAAALIVLFLALLRGHLSSPARSVSTASLLSAMGAGIFAYFRPRRAWAWGILLSSGFWLYLVAVFATFALEGPIDTWPLIDASIILVSACAGALAASRVGCAVRGATPSRSLRSSPPSAGVIQELSSAKHT